jgi:putative spermidine/putrescine transport system permease protein
LRWFGEALGWSSFRASLTTSIVVALVVTLLACVMGTAAAVAIARYRFPGSRTLQSLFMAPLALPQLILAIGMIILFSRLAAIIGVRLTATLPGLIVSHLVVAVPWTIRTVGAVMATLDPHMEEMAQSLGASPVRAFFLVTLPLLYRGMVAGAIFAFIISFGNLELSLMVYPPALQPLPVMLYDQVRATPDLRIPAVSVLTMLIVGTGIALADRLGGLDKAL